MDPEARLIQVLTVTGISIVAKIWKQILLNCKEILANSWNPGDAEVRMRIRCLIC